MYAKDNKQSCLIQKTSNGKIEYNTKYGKNCTMLRPVTLTDVNVVTLDKGLELNGACVLNGSDLAYYVNIEKINNKLILNNDSYNVKCKNGYNTTDGKGFVYKCSNGNLTFDNENSSIDSDCVLIKCEKTSPVYDKNNNRVADHLYGITFASRVDDYRPFTVCYTDSLSNDVSIITGNLEVEPGKFASCSNDRVKGTNYYNFIGRTVDCVSGNSSTNFKPYWVMRSVSSCPLDTLVKTYSGLEIKFGYEGVIKPVEEIMTSGAKQIRVFKHRDDYDKVNANLKSVEGNSITGTVLVTCNNDDSWKVESNGTIDYVYTGNVQTFTPKYYGAEGKKLTLEVWGGSGSCDRGGLGGYSKGIEKGSSLKDKLYIVVGGSGDGANGGYNGGGNGSSNWPCGGGGATHIATSTGVLALLESKKKYNSNCWWRWRRL